MVIFGGALTWLGRQLLDQDRSLERQRTQEGLEQAADYVAAELLRSVSGLEGYLTVVPSLSAAKLPTGVVILLATHGAVDARPAGRLLFYPTVPTGEPERSSVFAEGETLEYRLNDPVAASEIYRVLAKSPDPGVRAGALLRQGRSLRKAGHDQESLRVYDELGRLGSLRVQGLPSELVAREARCTVLEAIGRIEELRHEASLMHSDLFSGRWILLRPAWEFHMEEARRWSGAVSITEDERNSLLLSHAALWTYDRWVAEPESSGRRILMVDGRPALVSWKADSGRLAALLADPGYLDLMWSSVRQDRRVDCGLVDEGGRTIMGSFDSNAQQAIRTSAATRLPWTLHVTSADPGADSAAFAARRRILLSAFAVLAMVLAAGSYFILRSIYHERAVARLQSEFVSAVTHEFRTPLTSLRQLSEMLSKGRVPTEELRQQSYDIMARESERLQRLVESILDFGRIEARAVQYHFQALDPKAMVRDVVAEFQEHVANEGYHIEVTAAEEFPLIRADREALGLALWNLLDNAVKYSPDCRIVGVEMIRSRDRVAIHVQDRGMGIPKSEQKEVFKKFVRGAGSRNANIEGTGIGLAMARSIVEAHDGEIRLESELGRGSTFTVLLPLEGTA